MRPSYLDRNIAEPSATPATFAEGHEMAAHQAVVAERDAANAKIADLEQALASTEGELQRAAARADNALEQVQPLHVEINRLNRVAAQADDERDAANKRAEGAEESAKSAHASLAETEAELERKTKALAEAEAQIAELTKPKDPEKPAKKGSSKD